MKRAELEHIIRAVGAIAEVDKLVIVGSQAVRDLACTLPPSDASKVLSALDQRR